MGRRNPLTDWAQFFLGERYPSRNQARQIWWRSLEGFRGSCGSNFSISHWLCWSSLQHSHTTVWACDHSPVSQIAYIFCAFCPVPSLILLWIVLLGPHHNLWLCDLSSVRWHKQPLKEVVEALAPNIVQFRSLLYHGTSLHNTLSTCLRFVQLQSNYHQVMTGYIFWVTDLTIWKSCLEFPFELAASNSMHLPSSCCFLSTLSFLCTSAFSSWHRFLSLPLLLSFPWLMRKSHQISISGNNLQASHHLKLLQNCLKSVE